MSYIEIPTYENQWTTTSFKTREEFRDFILSIFKEPGQYGFDETSHKFNEQARIFNKDKVYCIAPSRSKDYVTYWDDQKTKNRCGAIYKNNGKTWYLTRDYYMWLNFLPIFDKEEGHFGFAKVRDAQYHMALYELLAELHNLHAAILKKRQIASSYFHCAKLINQIWFEEGVTMKMGASHKDFINEKGTWKFLTEYRNFLDKHTAWYRPMNPGKVLMWQQQIEVVINNRKTSQGNKGTIQGLTFDKDPTNGVGGPCVLKDTLIVMHDGTLKKVQDIILNDYIIGIDGKPKKVTKLYSGKDLMYKVSQSKGDTYVTTGDHKLYLWDIEKKSNIIIKTKDFISLSQWKKKTVLKGVKYNGIENKYKNLLIDPYYLGLYLGDGCKYDYRILVNKTKDIEISNYIYELAKKEGYLVEERNRNLYRKDYNDQMWDMKLSSGYKIKTMLPAYHHRFEELGLNNKHIPESYFTASKQQRFELLAGILDTDGYLNNKKHRFELSIKSKKLAYDIQKLCIHLGLDAHIHIVNSTGKTSTVYKYKTSCYRLNITGDITHIPTKILRKKATKSGIKSKNRFSSLKVTKYKVDNYYGFECEDNLFILKDGTITHNCRYFFYEEGGIAPTADTTIEYLLPAMKSGLLTTGLFIIAGSVGDLEQCEPLKKMILYPSGNDIYAVTTNLIDEKGTTDLAGLFIPEQWSMPPYIDEFGNSLVEEANKAIDELRLIWKRDLSPEKYQLRISQHPRNIQEAFAYRKISIFPQVHVQNQIRRIEEKLYPYEFLDIHRNEEGKVAVKDTGKLPISEFPISPKREDKEGVLVCYERPIKDAEFGLYYASIDPVSEGKTTTSESLCTIYIYKNAVQVTKADRAGKMETFIERDGIVASWCGRFNDISKTHERLELIIEWYNAWTIVENNVSLFIQHMIAQRKQKYLVPKDQILFLKDLGANQNVYQEYGWKNTGTLFKTNLLSYAIEYLTESLDTETKPDGTIVKTTYGVERIPDPMLLAEMAAYQPGLNVDRLIAFSALVAFVAIQKANRGIRRRVDEDSTKNLDKSKNLYKLNKGLFHNMGSTNKNSDSRPSRNPFKNLR